MDTLPDPRYNHEKSCRFVMRRRIALARIFVMHIRAAHPDDAAAVTEILARAYPTLMAPSYAADVLALALPAMTKANPELLASGTYYVAEDAGGLFGCGGWTAEEPGSRTIEGRLAHLRHFATDPDMARRGIGRLIFGRCAFDAMGQGMTRFQAFAGLNAEPFYQSLGLSRLKVIDVQLGPTIKLSAVLMEGTIPSRIR